LVEATPFPRGAGRGIPFPEGRRTDPGRCTVICGICKKHASFEHTVFKGMSPVKVTLCPECAQKAGAEAHIEKIKSTKDKAAKHAAVDEFLKAVGKG
jgi:hypothetical protein